MPDDERDTVGQAMKISPLGFRAMGLSTIFEALPPEKKTTLATHTFGGHSRDQDPHPERGQG